MYGKLFHHLEDECHELDVELATKQIVMTTTVLASNSFKTYYDTITMSNNAKTELARRQNERTSTMQAYNYILALVPGHPQTQLLLQTLNEQTRRIYAMVRNHRKTHMKVYTLI